MSNVETNASANTSEDAKKASPVVHATITINGLNIIVAAFGAGAVLALFHTLQFVGTLFAPAVPFIFGSVLFATLVAAFFMLLRAQKTMRRSKRLRISFGDAYTGVSIFISMGFFAMACLHAFKGDGTALSLWTNGVATAGLAVCGYGVGKFCASLWNEGKKA